MQLPYQAWDQQNILSSLNRWLEEEANYYGSEAKGQPVNEFSHAEWAILLALSSEIRQVSCQVIRASDHQVQTC